MAASRDPLRIVFITQWYDPESGSAVTPGIQARALAALGHHVEVLTGWPHYPSGTLVPDFRRRPYTREMHGDIAVHRVPEYPSHDSSAVSRMATYLSFAMTAATVAPALFKSADVALVHSTPATAAIPAMVLRRTRGVPYVVHIQDLWPETVLASGFARQAGTLMRSGLDRFCDATYRSADSIAVTSPGMATSIQARGVPPEKLSFAPNWADESVFDVRPRKAELAAALGLPPDAFVVMYAGNVGHIQGLDILVRAAALLRDRPDIHFAIVGRGIAREELRAQVSAEGLDRLHFVDPQPFATMGDVLALGDAQLISFTDRRLFELTLPSKLQATLASGRPILGAVKGDAAGVIRAAKAGLVVEPGDAQGLAQHILTLAESPGMASEMSQAGRAAYVADFSEAASVARLDSLLRRAAAKGHR